MDLGKMESERRKCKVCGRVYWSEERGLSALQQLAAHLISHQPGPEQWTEAYLRIEEKRQKNRPVGE